MEEKGKTSYNEVADELVREFMDQKKVAEAANGGKPIVEEKGKKSPHYDEKNIRRRVYDALNVLMAMDIISKEKKEITWCGLPSNAHRDLDLLKRERDAKQLEVERKRESLRDLVIQQIGFKRLCERNRQEEGSSNDSDTDLPLKKKSKLPSSASESASASASVSACTPAPKAMSSSTSDASSEEKIHLPFIVVNTSKNTIIQCEMGTDRTDVFFNFSEPFEINDDNEILRRLGLQKASREFLQSSLPKDLYDYCEKHNMLDVVMGLESDGNGNGNGNADLDYVGEKGKGGLDALLQQL